MKYITLAAAKSSGQPFYWLAKTVTLKAGVSYYFMTLFSGSVASTKFNRFQLKKFKCHKINSIENQHFSYLSDSIFHKEKQKNRQMRQNQKFTLC